MLRFSAWLVGVAFLSLIGSALVPPAPAQAYTVGSAPIDHQPPGYYNAAEQSAWFLCNYGPGTKYSARGAIWFSSDSSSYYSLGVTVVDGQDFVPVYIRGSVYSCSQNLLNTTIYATSISPQGPQGSRLTGLSGTSLNRGTFLSAGGRRWTSQGGSVAATLDVRGLATNNAISTATETISIDLYRCYSTDGKNGVNCYAETVPIVVTRTPPEGTYTNSATSEMHINGGSTPAANNSTVRVGDTVTWNYKLTTTQDKGAFKNRTVDYTFRCLIDGVSFYDDPPSSNYTFTSPGTQDISGTGPACDGTFKPIASDVGKTICHRFEFAPVTQAGGIGYTEFLCVKVVAGTVSPQLTMTPAGSRIADGSDLRFDFGAANATNPAVAGNICYQARIWYEKSPTPNSTYEAGTDALYYRKASMGCGGGAEAYANIPANTTMSQILTDSRAVDITRGGKICADWYIESTTNGIGTGSPNPAWKCIVIGKTPGVQVWGNDVRVGSALSSSGAATAIVRSALTRIETPPIVQTGVNVLGSGSDAKLMRTGVDASGNKIKVNFAIPSSLQDVRDSSRTDLHWEITKVMRPNGSTVVTGANASDNYTSKAYTCQYAYDATGSIKPMDVTRPAIIVAEGKGPRSWGSTEPYTDRAGQFVNMTTTDITGKIYAQVVGNKAAPGVLEAIKDGYTYPYAVSLSGSSSWIAQNTYALDYNDESCKDPGQNAADIDAHSNIYVFHLKNTFDLADGVDLNTVTMSLRGAADNQAKIFVNGQPLTMTSGDIRPNGYSRVDFSDPNATYTATAPAGVFRTTGNTLEVYVQSSGSSTALRIDDVVVRGTVSTSSTKYYGSWGEYGVWAPSDIGLLASGSGLALGHDSADQGSWSKLSFANKTAPYGNFASATAMGTIPNIAGYFAGVTMPGQKISRAGAVTISNTSSDKPADLTQPGGRVLIASGKVTIADNIVASAAARVDDMRQVVIIAPDIEIAGSVTQVDAWLIATNSINTCSDVAVSAPLSSSICNRPLKVNGALTSSTVYLRRTAGNDKDTRREAAEVLDLRGDAFIWARGVSEKNGTWTTRSVTELPPRY